MKSRLLAAIRYLVPAVFFMLPVSAGAENPVDATIVDDHGTAAAQLGDFLSLESVLLVVFVLLVLAVIAHRTKSP